MGNNSWVVENLNNALATWNGKLQEIWQLLLTSPEAFRGGSIWGIIVNIHDALKATGFALLVLFFVMGVVKTTTNFSELKRPEHAVRLFLRFAIAKAVDGVRVTDEEAKKFFEENEKDLNAGESVSASHILVDSEEKANEIKAEIESGAVSFEDAARKYSSCPSSEQGGALGEFTRGQMVPEFDEACFSMKVGELRGPVKTQFGYHLIKLNDKKEATPLKYEDIADQIKQKLLTDKQQAAYRSKVNQLKILYPVDIL